VVGKISQDYCRTEGSSWIDSTSRETDLHKDKQKRMETMLGVLGDWAQNHLYWLGHFIYIFPNVETDYHS